MKRCPQCRRDYFDDSLAYCLDDGSVLVDGPSMDAEPPTAIFHDTSQSTKGPTELSGHLTDQTAILPPVSFESRAKSWTSARIAIAAALLVTLTAVGVIAYRSFRTANSGTINSIAVMPFVNDSGNPDIDYLSDGMTESLIKGLTNIPNVSVKARSSVFRYKGQEPDIKKVAADLGVQALLNGHMSQRGDEIALSLELIDASTENVLWTERYLRKQAELVSLQSEIAKDVSDSLRAKLSPDDQAKVTKEYTANPDAYQLYLKGRFLLSKATPEAQKQSVEYFDRAIALDPSFSLAYSGKADAYTLLGTVFDAQMSPSEAMQNARVAAENALKLDPSLAAAYTSRAWIKFRFDWDWSGAEEDFKRATALEPRNAQAHQWYGEFLSCMGRHDEAIAEMRSARDLEPFSPIISWNLGKVLFTANRYDEAMTEFQRTLELDPNFARVFRFTSILYERKGMMKEAFEAFSKQREIATLNAVDLRHTFETEGLSAARRKAFEWYSRQADTPIMRALAYAALNKKQYAMDELEKAYADRAGALVGLKTENPWDSLRDEPRFQDLLRRMKFPN